MANQSWALQGFAKDNQKWDKYVGYAMWGHEGETPEVLCPDCGANVLVHDGDMADFIGLPKPIPMVITYQCELGCGHTYFIR